MNMHYFALISLFVATMFGFPSPQVKTDRPLTSAQVLNAFTAERNSLKSRSSGPNLAGKTKAEVERVGVDFEADSKTEQEFRRAGMPNDLIDAIKRNLRTATLLIKCEPVECDVTIAGSPAGKTFGGALTKTAVPAGDTVITATAPNFETKTAAVL